MNKSLPLLLTILLLAIFACSLGEDTPPPATSPAVETPTLASEGATSLVPASATPPPAIVTELPPTATQLPPATATTTPPTPTATTPSGPATERIVFDPGATGATVEAEVSPLESDRYVLRAVAGQILSVHVTTPAPATILLAIYGAGGTLLKRDAVGGPAWSGPLPATEDYTIVVRTAGETTGAAYTLQVDTTPLAAPAPERITFAAGATSASAEGTLAAQGGVRQYLLAAQAGQRMQLQVTSDAPGIVVYSLRDPAGQTLAVTTDPTPLVAFLPETGDYLITLTTHNIAPAVAYTLSVEVVDAGTLPKPQRVVFEPGATAAAVAGTLPSGGSRSYILTALGGQTMTLDLTAQPAGALNIFVETEGGAFLTAGTGEAPLSLTLPSTQDYLLILTSPFAAPAVTYELAVEIE